MAKVFASGGEIDVIWYDDIIGWYDACEQLNQYGIGTSSITLIKENGSDRAGIGISDPNLYTQAKMILS